MGQNDLSDLPPAIILGRPNANLLGQVRALGRQGVTVYCILTRGEPPVIARLSRYVDRIVDMQHAGDDEIVKAIKKLSENHHTQPVLFFGGDYDITLAARIWPRISTFVTAVTPPVEAARFNDKACQVERVLAEGMGVVAPGTLVIHSVEDVDRAQAELTFPVICRPVELAKKGLFEGKMFVAEDENVMRQRLAPVFAGVVKGEILVQEYIEGGNDQLYFTLASCDCDGNVEAMVTGRKLYEYPKGLMCIGETVQDPALSDAAWKVFRAFSLSGVLGVEFKYDSKRQEYYFIEVNFRPENILSIAERSGVNIMYHAYLKAIHRPELYSTPNEPQSTLWRDISLIALSRLTGGKPPVHHPNGRKTVDAYWSFSDPLPAIAWYVVKLWRVVKGRLYGRTFE